MKKYLVLFALLGMILLAGCTTKTADTTDKGQVIIEGDSKVYSAEEMQNAEANEQTQKDEEKVNLCLEISNTAKRDSCLMANAGSLGKFNMDACLLISDESRKETCIIDNAYYYFNYVETLKGDVVRKYNGKDYCKEISDAKRDFCYDLWANMGVIKQFDKETAYSWCEKISDAKKVQACKDKVLDTMATNPFSS